MTPRYKWNKSWRLKHPKKRYEGKQRYYDKTKNSPNKGNRWMEWETELVMAHEIPDSELSKELGRSVSSIQARRYLVKKQNEWNEIFGKEKNERTRED